MADTKITRLRNLMTPVKNYFALVEKCDKEESLIQQDKIMAYADDEKEKVLKVFSEILDIIGDIPDNACEQRQPSENSVLDLYGVVRCAYHMEIDNMPTAVIADNMGEACDKAEILSTEKWNFVHSTSLELR